MADAELARQVGNIKAVLESIEAQVERGKVPPEALADIKARVDEVRLRLWATMSAASSGEYETFAQRFRLRRATEICRGLADDITSGKAGTGHAEAQTLRAAVQSLAAALGKEA